MFGLFVRVLERGKFLYNKMAELVAEVEESVVDGCSFDLYTGILSWVENGGGQNTDPQPMDYPNGLP